MDGTVWDSFPWYAAVLAQETGANAASILALLRHGSSVVTLCRRTGVSDARFHKLCEVYGAGISLYPGVRESLRTLNSRGVTTAVVTSLPARIAEPLLEGSGIRTLFRDIVTASNCAARKPSPVPLTFALSRIGVVPDRDVFYVGDQAGDAACAEAAGASFAWASYGYGKGNPGISGSAVLESFGEVLLL